VSQYPCRLLLRIAHPPVDSKDGRTRRNLVGVAVATLEPVLFEHNPQHDNRHKDQDGDHSKHLTPPFSTANLREYHADREEYKDESDEQRFQP